MKKIVIVSASLNKNSNSSILAQTAKDQLTQQGFECIFIDAREYQLPLCDGGSTYGNDIVRSLQHMVDDADGIVYATPVYNYSVNSWLKTFIEHCGRNLQMKPVGFLSSAGGSSSYMSITNFSMSLMLDFRNVILPRFVYAQESDFENNSIINTTISDRVSLFVKEFAEFVTVLAERDLPEPEGW